MKKIIPTKVLRYMKQFFSDIELFFMLTLIGVGGILTAVIVPHYGHAPMFLAFGLALLIVFPMRYTGLKRISFKETNSKWQNFIILLIYVMLFSIVMAASEELYT